MCHYLDHAPIPVSNTSDANHPVPFPLEVHLKDVADILVNAEFSLRLSQVDLVEGHHSDDVPLGSQVE